MKSVFNTVAIEVVASTIPNGLQELNEEYLNIPQKDIDKITNITGISKVALAADQITASDLCLQSARSIFEANPTLVSEIDAIIFVSQTRDFILPSTASIMQDRLKLSTACLCLDIPSGCTGFLHGLFVASSFIHAKACKKVLLLCGETNSKIINKKDRSVSMVFGDAGSAIVLGHRPNLMSFFNFHTDGSGYEDIIIQDGGARNGFNSTSLTVNEFENGNLRHAMNLKMDGMSVFNFAINSVPPLVRDSLVRCQLAPTDIDLFAAHQANRLIVKQMAKKCGFRDDQSPFLAGKTGNTGPASIPLLLSEGFANCSSELNKVVMCGFGVGLNWGVCITDLSDTIIYDTENFLGR